MDARIFRKSKTFPVEHYFRVLVWILASSTRYIWLPKTGGLVYTVYASDANTTLDFPDCFVTQLSEHTSNDMTSSNTTPRGLEYKIYPPSLKCPDRPTSRLRFVATRHNFCLGRHCVKDELDSISSLGHGLAF